MDNQTLVENEKIINEAIRRATEKANAKDQIQTILAYVGDKMHADRAYIFEVKEPGVVSETYEWCANGVHSDQADLQNMHGNAVTDVATKLLQRDKFVIFSDEDKESSEMPGFTEFLRNLGIHRMVTVALYIGGDFIGFLGITDPSKEHMQGAKELVTLLGAFMSSVIARRNSELRMKELTERDPVTGTWSMSRLVNYMEQRRIEHERRNARDRFQCIIYLNIMQFTLYNDAFGYEAGNECLKKIAEILQDVFETEYITRANADRFIVFYHNSDDIEKIKLAHDIILHLIPGHELWLEAGIYYMNSAFSDHISTMCDLAKIACDRNPNHGVKYCMVYSAELRKNLERRKYIQDHIDIAMAKGYVQVYFQPVVRTLTGKVCNAEALSRWIDPTYGMIPPSEFVPALEEKNLSWKLDRYVIHECARIMRELLDAGQTVVPVSVNLSRKDFETARPISSIEASVREYDLERYYFCIEITESAVMSHPKIIQESIEEFHNAGYEVWMDDFGSGYSSLNALRNFDFDEIKIDMDFMRNLDDRSREIVKNIVNMAKDLGIRTLCEGVETKEQFEFLKDLGCERIQGFYFGKPLPIVTLQKHLRKHHLQLERREEMKLYNSFSDYHFDQDKNFGISFYDGQKEHIFYISRSLQKMLVRDGIHGCQELSDLINGSDLPFSEKIRTLGDRMNDKEPHGETHFSLNGHSFLLDVILAAHGKIGRIYIASISDIMEEAEREGNTLSDSILRDLTNAFYGIYQIDFDRETVKIISSAFPYERTGDVVPWQTERMNEAVYWRDRDRFQNFFKKDAMNRAFHQQHQSSFTDIFRINSDGKGYTWFAFTVIRISDTDQDHLNCLLCIKPSAYEDVNKARTIAETVLEGTRPEGVAEEKSDEWNTAEHLWESMNEQDGIKIFWKDKNRRFKGASKAFLDFYGMTSEDDIIGKTDEEIGWHIDDTVFRKNEEEVLKGKTLLHQRGQNVIHGKVYNIVYTKMPAYHYGKICGLIGMFSDETEYLRNWNGSAESSYTDHTESVMNSVGGILTLRDYEDNFKGNGEVYYIAVLYIRNYWRVRLSLGKEAAEKLIKTVTDSFEQKASRGYVACRVNSERIAIGTKLGAEQLQDKIQELQQTVERIHRIGDYHGQPVLSSGIASRSEASGAFQTFELANARSEGHKKIGTREVQINGRDYMDIARDMPTPYVLGRCILNQAGDQVVDATLLYVNFKYCQMVHRSQEQLIGKSYLNSVPNSDPIWLNYAYQAAVLHKEVQDTIFCRDTNGIITFRMAPASMPLTFCLTGFPADDSMDRDTFFKRNWTTDDRVLRIVRIINSSMSYRDMMHQVLREIAAIIHPDRIHLIDFSANALDENFEWCKDGIPSAADAFQRNSRGITKYTSHVTAENEMSEEIVGADEIEKDYPEVAVFLHETGTDRVIWAPVYEGGRAIAFLEAENYRINVNMDIRKFMETIAVFISERMVNYHVMKRLNYLSYHDGLTNVQNSHAYKRKKALLQQSEQPVGVIYVDMNGLKEVNDKIGHEEGDRRLKQIADFLSDLYIGENVYRVGGDEFLVILSGLSKEDFEKQLQEMKERLKQQPEIRIAVGSRWAADANGFAQLVHEADQEMYLDKAAYYTKHDRRRR